MKITSKKGFTLIEILVVILIIGLLAAVVLAMLGSAQDKGSNGAIKASSDSLRKQAELAYNNNNLSYGSGTMSTATNCVSSPSANSLFNSSTSTDSALIAKMVQDINVKAGGNSSGTTLRVACSQTAPTNWAFAVLLKGSNAGTYCLDSRGGSPKIVTTNTAATQAINNTNATCN